MSPLYISPNPTTTTTTMILVVHKLTTGVVVGISYCTNVMVLVKDAEWLWTRNTEILHLGTLK